MNDNPYQAPQALPGRAQSIDTQTFRGSARRGFMLGATIGAVLAVVSTLLQVVFVTLYYFHFQRFPRDADEWTLLRLPAFAISMMLFSGTVGSFFMVLFTGLARLRPARRESE